MKEQIRHLERQVEQGPLQRQGDVLEIEVGNVLWAAFPVDQIESVPTGMRGADVLQRVRNNAGEVCGTIIWESKTRKTGATNGSRD
jgi:hypothetical protein